jgi:hypothetical protein
MRRLPLVRDWVKHLGNARAALGVQANFAAANAGGLGPIVFYCKFRKKYFIIRNNRVPTSLGSKATVVPY